MPPVRFDNMLHQREAEPRPSGAGFLPAVRPVERLKNMLEFGGSDAYAVVFDPDCDRTVLPECRHLNLLLLRGIFHRVGEKIDRRLDRKSTRLNSSHRT